MVEVCQVHVGFAFDHSGEIGVFHVKVGLNAFLHALCDGGA